MGIVFEKNLVQTLALQSEAVMSQVVTTGKYFLLFLICKSDLKTANTVALESFYMMYEGL